MAKDKIVETPVEEKVVAEAPTTKQTDQPAPDAEQGATPGAKPRKRKAKRTVTEGQVHVLATFNNTLVTITDSKGNTLTTASAGASGFRGSKKGTAYAAQIAVEKAVEKAKQNYGVSKVDVFVKGIGMGRDAAVRSLVNQKLDVENVRDVTPIAHGGVRRRRPKRN